MNKKNLYEQQEDIIRKQSEAFITLLTHRGILGEQSIDKEKLYNLIYETYIAPEKLSLTDILYRLDMSPGHYYRLREQAITILSIRLWAAPKKYVKTPKNPPRKKTYLLIGTESA